MNDMNYVFIQGRIVRDAEKSIRNDVVVVKFAIAVNRQMRDEDGNYVQETSFINLAIFGTYADKMSDYLVKGRQVIVEGHLKQNRWEIDGKTINTIGLAVHLVRLIGSKISTNAPTDKNELGENDDIPFEQTGMIFDDEISEEMFDSYDGDFIS